MAFLGLRRKVLQQMKHNEKYEEIAEVLNQAVADQTKIWIENGGKMCKKHCELYYEITGLHVFHEAQCLKITQNVSFEFFNFGIFHQFLSY